MTIMRMMEKTMTTMKTKKKTIMKMVSKFRTTCSLPLPGRRAVTVVLDREEAMRNSRMKRMKMMTSSRE